MFRLMLRVVKRRSYARDMRTPHHVEPQRQMAGLDHWAGMWIAVKNGEVIAAAYNSA